MKIAIAIMSSNHAVSHRNTECQIETFVNNLFEKERNNEYRVYVYRGRKDSDEKVGVTCKGNYYEIVCAANDSKKHMKHTWRYWIHTRIWISWCARIYRVI